MVSIRFFLLPAWDQNYASSFNSHQVAFATHQSQFFSALPLIHLSVTFDQTVNVDSMNCKKIVSRDSTHSFNYKKSQHKSRSLSEGIKSPQDLIKTKSRLYWATHYLLTHTEGWNGRMSLSLPSNRNYSTHKIATGPQIKCWIWTEEVMVMGSGFTPDLGSGAVFMASMILRFLATYVVDGEHGFLWSSTSAHCMSSKSILRK